jgi:uncharacterized protein
VPLSHIVGFDDAPFPRSHRGDVLVVGAVCSGARLEGVLTGRVRRDGANATRTLVSLTAHSKYAAHLQLVMLQGIAMAGFNVVDVHTLSQALSLPVLVIARYAPDLAAMREALLTRVPGGARKWKLIEQAGAMEPLAGVYVQRVGITSADAAEVIRRTAVHGRIPEPLRTAHLIAGGIATGESRGRT